jgi:endonuclease-3 related protein
MKIYTTLLDYYGDLDWWPANTPYEVMVGAILTQNTAWGNVEKAIANFGDNLTPEFIRDVDISKLSEIIHPAGFFNQKAGYLKEVTRWYANYNFDATTVQKENMEKLRVELLAVKGVGRETADSILLYAFNFPTFVVDAYTTRLCSRIPIDVGKGYEQIKASFEKSIPRDIKAYNNNHALIVINGKNHCRKKPLCNGCPLFDMCEKYGIT